LKYIKKSRSPLEFECWKKQTSPKNWEELPGSLPQTMTQGIFYYSKNELRQYLSNEQGSTCCYCEMKVNPNPIESKIDHIIPQTDAKGKNLIFMYTNLGLSCNGGERDRIRPRELHCDSHKSNSIIKLTPYYKSCEKKVIFDLNGKISTNSKDAENTVAILNLGIAKLINNRRNAIAGYIYVNVQNTQLISSDEANKLLKNLKNRNDLPFKTAIIQALKLLTRENKSFIRKIIDSFF